MLPLLGAMIRQCFVLDVRLVITFEIASPCESAQQRLPEVSNPSGRRVQILATAEPVTWPRRVTRGQDQGRRMGRAEGRVRDGCGHASTSTATYLCMFM